MPSPPLASRFQPIKISIVSSPHLQHDEQSRYAWRHPLLKHLNMTKGHSINTTNQKKRQVAPRTVRAPAAVARRRRMAAPSITQHGNRTVIEHTEYIGEFASDIQNNFAYYADSITPTNASLFPWLASIAERYESFVFRELEFMIETSSPTSTSGNFIIAVDYDAVDPDASQTKASLMNMYGSEIGAVWQNVSHRSTRANLSKIGPQRYNVQGDETVDRTNVAGVAYLAATPVSGLVVTTAQPPTWAIQTLGERWVRYSIELFTPQLVSSLLDSRPNEPQMRRRSAANASTSGGAAGAQMEAFRESVFQPFAIDGSLGDEIDQYVSIATAANFDSGLPPTLTLPGNWINAETGVLAELRSSTKNGLGILQFKRDFEGLIKVVMSNLTFGAGVTINPASVAVEQWIYNGGAGVGSGTSKWLTPDLDANEYSIENLEIVNDSTGKGLFLVDILAKVAAGTGISLTTGQSTASTTPAFVTSAAHRCTLDICPLGLATGGAFLKKKAHNTRGVGPVLNGRRSRVEFVKQADKPSADVAPTTVTFALLK